MYSYQSLPSQKNTQKEKQNKEWQEACVNAIISMSFSSLNYLNRTQADKQINYDLINGQVDYSKDTHITDPYKVNSTLGGQPATLRCIPIAQTKVNTLLGNELKRKFKYKAICTGGKGVERKEELKSEYIKNWFRNKVYAELGIDPDNLPEDFQEPKQILDFFNYKYEDLSEIYANRILQQVMRKDNLKLKFNLGFKHVIAVSEEIYRVVKKNDEPHVRVIDPRFFWVLKSDEGLFIEDGYIYKEERWMTPAEIIDEKAEFLSEADLEKLGDYFTNTVPATEERLSSYYNTNFPGSVSAYSKQTSHTIQVFETVWASQQELSYLYYTDEFDNQQVEVIFDESFKLSPEQKADSRNRLVKGWITQWWQGTSIGYYQDQIIIDVKPCEVQMAPYIGAIHNSLNSKTTSLIDYIKPIQHLYDVTFYRFEDEMSKAQGKKISIDVSKIPKDMSLDQWMYNFRTSNIIWTDSAQEGSEYNSNSNQSQVKEIDLSLSNSINGYMAYMNKLEQLMDKITSVSANMEGEASPYQSNQLYQNATNNSFTITEPYFYLHDIVKRNVLTYIVEFSKHCYKDKQHDRAFLNSDLIREAIDFDILELEGSKLGVFIQDIQEDEEVFTFIKQNSQAAIQNQMADFVDIVEGLKSNSLSESIDIFKKGRDKKQQIDQNKIDQENAIKDRDFAQKDKERNEQYQFELLKQKNDLDSKERLKQFELGVQSQENTGGPTFNDLQQNSLKEREFSFKQSQEQQNQLLKQNKDNTDYMTKIDELRLKEREIKSKEYIATINKNQYSPSVSKKDYKKKPKK